MLSFHEREIMFAYSMLTWLQCMIPKRTKEGQPIGSVVLKPGSSMANINWNIVWPCVYTGAYTVYFCDLGFLPVVYFFPFFQRFGVIVGKALYN
jgi:hypothetical protein